MYKGLLPAENVMVMLIITIAVPDQINHLALILIKTT